MARVGGKQPGSVVPQPPSLPEAEQSRSANAPHGRVLPEQVQQQVVQTPPRKMSAADAERLASQSGFTLTGKKRKRDGAVELDAVTEGPIPLPREDVDEESWEQSTLSDAQEELTLQGAQLKELVGEVQSEGPGELGIFAQLLRKSVQPTEAGLARLESLSSREAEPAFDQQALQKSMHQHFGLNLQGIPAGPTLVAASLVVAGHRENVAPEGNDLQADKLAQGMQRMVEKGHESVEDARGMHQGIDRELARHRTFLFKR